MYMARFWFYHGTLSKKLCRSLKFIGCAVWADFFFLTAWNVSKYGVFSGPYFPAFILNTERYFVSLRIKSECEKIRTRKNSVFGHISRNDCSSNSWLTLKEMFMILKKRKWKNINIWGRNITDQKTILQISLC